MKNKGTLFIISGPSGVGKGAMRKLVTQLIGGITYSISCTTRSPRGSETDGTDYHFISHDEFKDKLEKGLFLEHAVVHNQMYGTLRGDLEQELDAGRDVILEIDVQGALQVCKTMPCIKIFVMPPSRDELENRLRNRASETDETINVRLRNASEEMTHVDEYEHVIVNDKLERAAEELKNIILKYRNK